VTDPGVEFFQRLSSHMMATVASFAKVSRLLRDHAYVQVCLIPAGERKRFRQRRCSARRIRDRMENQ